ncbi:MAG: hypothetical protein R3281_18215, partial [Balneolaceae bacterium]|nr:hypothetical protein [Balneolaceae bacterium]
MQFINKLRHPLSALLLLAATYYITGCSEIGSVESRDEGAELQAESTQGKGAVHANEAATHTYRVTVENLTDGQPFSPGVLVTHTREARLWQAGRASSDLIIN